MMRPGIAAAATALLVGLSAPTTAQSQATMQDLGDGAYHYFSDWYSSLVVVGDDGVLVVDPAWDARGKSMIAEIAKITDRPVTHVVLSHEHYDHVGGTGVFGGADVVCHVTCESVFALDQSGVAPKKVTTTFEDKATIDLGGKAVELHHIAVGDGVATTAIYVPDAQVVATADLYLPQAFTEGKWLDDKNFLGTRVILNELAGWELRHAISGHSDNTDPAALKENAQYLNDLHDAVAAAMEAAVAEGGPDAAWGLLDTLPDSLELPQYKDWDGYEEHLPRHVWRMTMSILHGG